MQNQESTSLLGAVSRLFWMMIGPGLLALCTLFIVTKGNGWMTPADIGYFVVLAALMLARCLEFWTGNPQTSTGEAATPAHLRMYLLGVVVIGILVWAVANIIGNSVFGS